MSLLAWFLELSLLAMTYSVMASFIQPPKNQSVLLDSTATFSCVITDVVAVTYLVNSLPIYAVASLGVSELSPLINGSQTTVYLTIPAINYFNNSQVVCLTFLADDTRDDSPPAYLLVEAPAPPSPPAPPSAPLNLAHAAVGDIYVDLTWSPPMDLGIGGPLYYDVSYRAVSGTNGASNVASVINTTYTNITVTNLYPGVTYMMTVEAEDGVSGDECKRSASINVTTLPQTPTLPSPAPSNVVVGIVVPVMIVVLVVKWILVFRYRQHGSAKYGHSSLMLACMSGHVEVVEMLLSKGAQVDLQDKDGRSSLMWASKNGHVKVVEMLISKVAQVDLQDKDGHSSLMLACMSGHVEVVEMLFSKGAKVDLQDTDGHSSLMLASMNGHVKVVEMLLSKGAQVDLQDKDGHSSLMLASKNGHVEVVEKLLQGANTDLQDKDGRTALMMASQEGHIECVEVLLLRGADVNIQNNNGKTAVMVASKSKQLECEAALLQRGAYTCTCTNIPDNVIAAD